MAGRRLGGTIKAGVGQGAGRRVGAVAVSASRLEVRGGSVEAGSLKV